MLKTRLIPVLLLQNGLLVRSQTFNTHQIIGDPVHQVRRFNEWCVDELIYLDISSGDHYDQRRDDQVVRGLTHPMAILEAVSAHDPEGDGREHPEDVPAATDGDPDTYWTTERYDDFQKSGVFD